MKTDDSRFSVSHSLSWFTHNLHSSPPLSFIFCFSRSLSLHSSGHWTTIINLAALRCSHFILDSKAKPTHAGVYTSRQRRNHPGRLLVFNIYLCQLLQAQWDGRSKFCPRLSLKLVVISRKAQCPFGMLRTQGDAKRLDRHSTRQYANQTYVGFSTFSNF